MKVYIVTDQYNYVHSVFKNEDDAYDFLNECSLDWRMQEFEVIE